MKNKKTKLSIIDYAKKCRVSRTVIYKRIDSGQIIPLIDKGIMYIDLETTKIVKRKSPGRPSITVRIN